MACLKMRVPLSGIVPSGTNPRGDFGDIEALAETIRATGGEPVNPPVLVADGDAYRIVDGERRYRALCEIHGEGSSAEVTALVYDTLEEANEVVAMLATDDKKPLTEAERARGVQQMLLLGVPEDRAAGAARTTRGKVAALRRMAPRAPEGVQLTLDQALEASELPEPYAESVLAAGDGWETAARTARRAAKRDEDAAALRSALESAGWEVIDDSVDAAEGCRYAGTVYASSAERNIADLAARGACRACVCGDVAWAYAPKREGEDEEEARAQEELRRSMDEDAAACRSMADSMVAFILGGGIGSGPDGGVSAEMAEAGIEAVDEMLSYGVSRLFSEEEELGGYVMSSMDTEWAAMVAACRMIDLFRGGTATSYGPVRRALEALGECYDLLCIEGWEPSDADRAKRSAVRDAIDEMDGGDGR